MSDEVKIFRARGLTSIITRLPRFATATHFSSSNTTLQTDSAVISSRTGWPVLTSHTLTRPSLPPLTTRVSSNWRLVTLLSWAASRCIGHIFSRDHTLTDPSEPPVTSVLPRNCNCPTREVWPCKIAIASLWTWLKLGQSSSG